MVELSRCGWIGDDELMQTYHDQEWGVPVHDDRKWFEFVILDAFQAGLSWRTILHKRDNFRSAFDNFQPELIANYSEAYLELLLQNKGIIRNRLKIGSAVTNAQAFLQVREKYGSFDQYIWSFTSGDCVVNQWERMDEVPASTSLSDGISKDLKGKGFKFVGSTIVYSFLQSGGIVNDHLVSCFRHEQVSNI